MPARHTLVLTSLFAGLALGSCSSGLGNNLPTRPPSATGTNANLPLGVDLGVTPSSAVVEPAVAGVVVPAIGSQAARDVVLLAFASAAAANDADGAGNPLSRDSVTDGNGASDVFVAAICAQDVETRAFSQSLAGKFRHPRCATCHSMQAPGTLAFLSTIEGHAGPLPGPTFPNNAPDTCVPCHVNSTQFPVPGWQAPAVSFDLRSKTVAQLAEAATRVPIDETEHFVTDPRVLWALDSGILPQVGGRNGRADDDHDGVLEPEDSDGQIRTVPGGSTQFLEEIEGWRASGEVVTTAAAVKDITLVSRASGGGGLAASNGASSAPRVVWVANGSFNPTTASTAAATNPIGTLYVVYESTGSNIAGTDGNGVGDVYRAAIELRAEEDANGNALAGGLNLRYLDGQSVLCSAVTGTTTAGNGASSKPVIGGAAAQTVAFQSLATNLIGGFTDGNGAGSDVFVRRIGLNTTLLASHQLGANATGGNGSSESPALDPTGVIVAFESDASDLIATDTNGVRDVFQTQVDGSAPFPKVRASVTANGDEATGGGSSAAAVHRTGTRVRVAFQSAATNLANGLVAATNVYLWDSDSGTSTLLNQRITPTGSAIGDGSARAPTITADGGVVAFESDATNIDVEVPSDGNRASDVFLVETAPLATGNVLPFRASLTVTTLSDADGASTRPMVGSFTGSDNYQTGFLAFTTAATNLGTSDSTNVVVSFLDQVSGVTANFTTDVVRGLAPLTVQFTDTSAGEPTSWQWDFDNDGNVDATTQNPSFTFTTPGVFSVRLVAANANASGTITRSGLITAVTTITPDFTVSATSGVAPLTVTFTDASTQSPTAWAWDFENDSTVDATTQNPSHTYTTPGTYAVSLTATNEAGSATETKTGFVTVLTPVVAGFTASTTSGAAPLSVTFTNTSTGATSFSWDFESDGTPDSTATNPTHVFSTGGATTVTLTATGPGGTDTETLVITPASSASFTMTVSGNPITSAYEATTITFTSTSGGSPTTFSWDFDFAANPGVLTASGSSVSRTFTNTTSSTRTFTVRLVVNGPGGPAATQRTLTIVSDTESVTLTATRDNTIYQELTSNSNGDGTRMVVGRTAGTSSGSTASLSRRGLVQFNVSSIPANSTVSSATMSLTADTPALTGPQTITVHRLTSAWTEGNAAATGSSALAAAGVGAATSNGGATWNNRSFSTAWSTAGGDFAASSGSFSVDDVGTYNSTSLATDVQAWVNGTTNNGWLLRGTEASAFTVKRFRTREAITGAPTLTVVYTRPLP
jgi:PKD repeat protein